METLNLENEIMQVWKTLSFSQKESVIRLIQSFKEEEIAMTGEEIEIYNREIEEAEQRVSNGQYAAHEDVVKSFEKWK